MDWVDKPQNCKDLYGILQLLRGSHLNNLPLQTLKLGWVAFHSVKPRPNDCNMPTQHLATLLGATCCVRLATVLRHVGCCWLKFENGQIWANNTQHLATCRNTVAKRTQHVVPNNVAICWVGMLRSFGRGLTFQLKCLDFQSNQYEKLVPVLSRFCN